MGATTSPGVDTSVRACAPGGPAGGPSRAPEGPETAALRASGQPALERTAALLRRLSAAETGEERTRLLHEVVVANMPLADAIAQRYRARGIALQDLQQVAYLALTTAVQRFDPQRAADAVGPQFIAFAAVTIRGEVRRHFRDHGWVIRPPRRIQELQPRVTAANEEL